MGKNDDKMMMNIEKRHWFTSHCGLRSSQPAIRFRQIRPLQGVVTLGTAAASGQIPQDRFMEVLQPQDLPKKIQRRCNFLYPSGTGNDEFKMFLGDSWGFCCRSLGSSFCSRSHFSKLFCAAASPASGNSWDIAWRHARDLGYLRISRPIPTRILGCLAFAFLIFFRSFWPDKLNFWVSTCQSLFDLFCTVTQEFQCFLRNGMGCTFFSILMKFCTWKHFGLHALWIFTVPLWRQFHMFHDSAIICPKHQNNASAFVSWVSRSSRRTWSDMSPGRSTAASPCGGAELLWTSRRWPSWLSWLSF